jgi:hypothetical protein
VFLRYEEVGPARTDPNGVGIEEGYNTDYRPLQFDELTDSVHTHSVLLADVLGDDGFVHFVLDTNEPNSNTKKTISLDKLQIFLASSNLTHTYPGFAGEAVKVWDMDLGSDGDSSVLMTDFNHGSGQADMIVDIPITALADHPYLILYAKQGVYRVGGYNGEVDAGFEEWAVREVPQPPAIPLPAAAWSGLSLLGGLLGTAKLRKARCA